MLKISQLLVFKGRINNNKIQAQPIREFESSKAFKPQAVPIKSYQAYSLITFKGDCPPKK